MVWPGGILSYYDSRETARDIGISDSSILHEKDGLTMCVKGPHEPDPVSPGLIGRRATIAPKQNTRAPGLPWHTMQAYIPQKSGKIFTLQTAGGKHTHSFKFSLVSPRIALFRPFKSAQRASYDRPIMGNDTTEELWPI